MGAIIPNLEELMRRLYHMLREIDPCRETCVLSQIVKRHGSYPNIIGHYSILTQRCIDIVLAIASSPSCNILWLLMVVLATLAQFISQLDGRYLRKGIVGFFSDLRQASSLLSLCVGLHLIRIRISIASLMPITIV